MLCRTLNIVFFFSVRFRLYILLYSLFFLADCVDDGGWTSLIWACEFCHADVARYLLDKKCDPLIRDAEQNIALHWSAFSGSSEITEMLLNEGCDVNAVNVHGDTPLYVYCICLVDCALYLSYYANGVEKMG